MVTIYRLKSLPVPYLDENRCILATDLWEKQQQNSENSSVPPSKDNPYTSTPTTEKSNRYSELETGSNEVEFR